MILSQTIETTSPEPRPREALPAETGLRYINGYEPDKLPGSRSVSDSR